jgi:sterol desaturase/sphingolipid hydroxylase (fatty acid hydroxylase superfamily)
VSSFTAVIASGLRTNFPVVTDLTVAAVPGFFGTMAVERAALRRRALRSGPSPADYEARDTRTSLTMGTASLLAPLVVPRLLRPFTPGRGRFGRALVGTAVVAAVATAVADRIAGRAEGTAEPEAPPTPARRVAAIGGVVATVAGGVAVATAWTALTDVDRLWRRRLLPDLGGGPGALAAALVGWDLVYYWNHRLMHEHRFLWAIHVVHHSSERYNLSTALRQPVADALGVFVPYGALALLGIRPSLLARARELDLLYQYWIHTDTIRSLGPLEAVLNTPSHHRVHHGSNRRYLDRNHGGILILWDRLFGSFQAEREPVVYGLTTNITTFQPFRVATHEYAAMARDLAGARRWRDRLGVVLRRPGWRTPPQG